MLYACRRVLEMTEQEIKDGVTRFLESSGFFVTQIPVSQKPTPDLLAVKEQRYLIEIKTKEDDQSVLDARLECLRRRGIAEGGASFAPQNTMSGIIKYGVEKQLAQYPEHERDFCLLWLVAAGTDSEAQYQQFLGTLYGLTNVCGPDDLSLMPCYYFRNSAFFRWPKLDGAIVGTLGRFKLCVNSYSPQADTLKYSSLAERFATAVTDPRDLEARGEAYVADCHIDRRDEQGVIRYLQRKYDRPALMSMDLGMSVAWLDLQEEDGPE